MEQLAGTFTSARLGYTKFTPADFTNYLNLATNGKVMRYITGRALTEAEARTRFNNYLETNQLHPEAGFFSVNRKADGSFIGLAKLVYVTADEAEIGYSLLPDFWGQKYAAELVSCLLDYAASMPQLTRLLAIVDADNVVSVRLLTNHRFVRSLPPTSHSEPSVHYYRLNRPFGPQ